MSWKMEIWVKRYKAKKALWLHDDNICRPHAVLTSGKHSNGFFNSELIMEDAWLLDEACKELSDELTIALGRDVYHVSRVVGPAMGAITLAHSLAAELTRLRMSQSTCHDPCLRAYTEKIGEGEDKKMAFRRTTVQKGEKVLLCEDVVTTGGSVELTTKAVEEAGGIVLPAVVALVNRSGLTEINGKKIVALIDRPMPIWSPEECPLCKLGSEAIHPKAVENWIRLNAEY